MSDTTQQSLLVIGVTSLIGKRLLGMLSDFPGQVRFSSRNPLGPNQIHLDARTPAEFSPGVSFSHVVICAPIALISEALLLRLAELGMKRVVAFSSTSVFTKSASLDAAEQISVTKLERGERLVEEFCLPRGIGYTILRPTLIYDEGRDLNVTQIMRTIKRLGFFPVVGKAGGLRRPVHARDLAKGALQALNSPNAAGESYTLSGAECLTYREMVVRIFRSMERAPLIVPLPVFVWRAGFFALGLLKGQGKFNPNIEMALRMNKDMNFEHDKAARDFGYAPGAFEPDFSSVK